MKLRKRNIDRHTLSFLTRALNEMSTYLPIIEEEMLEVNGVGTNKFEKYGQEFMRIINEFVIEHEIETDRR